MYRLVAILLLLFPSLAWSQTIVGPTEPIAPKQPAWLAIEGVTAGSTATFFPTPQIQTGPPHMQPLHALFWAQKSGTYQVNGVAVNVDWTLKTISLVPLTCTVVVEGDGPDPPPPPPPPVDRLWGLMIYESNDLDNQPEFAKVVASTRLRAIDKFTLQAYDKDVKNETGQTPATLSPWLKIIADNKWPLPQLLLVSEAGDLVDHTSPTTVDATISFVEGRLK